MMRIFTRLRDRGLRGLVLLGASVSMTGCVSLENRVSTGAEQHETRSVDLDKSERVRAQLKMKSGELDIRGGAQKLADAAFTYNVPEWKPTVRYNPGDLVIEQSGSSNSGNGAKNHWDIRLNDGVPLDLRIEFGAGEARIDLGSVDLRSFDLQMGAGTLRLDLRGTPKHDYSVKVRGGAGDATVYLPKSAGISAMVSGGLGSVDVSGLRKSGDRYVNDAFEGVGVKVRVDIQGGVGSIKLAAE